MRVRVHRSRRSTKRACLAALEYHEALGGRHSGQISILDAFCLLKSFDCRRLTRVIEKLNARPCPHVCLFCMIDFSQVLFKKSLPRSARRSRNLRLPRRRTRRPQSEGVLCCLLARSTSLTVMHIVHLLDLISRLDSLRERCLAIALYASYHVLRH